MNINRIDLNFVKEHQNNMLQFSTKEMNIKTSQSETIANKKPTPRLFDYVYILLHNRTISLLGKLNQAGKY